MWLVIGACVVLIVLLLLVVSIRGAISNLHAEVVELRAAKVNQAPDYSKELRSIAGALSELKNEVRNIQREDSLDYSDFSKRFDDIDRELNSIWSDGFNCLQFIGQIHAECKAIRDFQVKAHRPLLFMLTNIEHFTEQTFNDLEDVSDWYKDSSERAASHHQMVDEDMNYLKGETDATYEIWNESFKEAVLKLEPKKEVGSK